jgi:hypothetical protein
MESRRSIIEEDKISRKRYISIWNRPFEFSWLWMKEPLVVRGLILPIIGGIVSAGFSIKNGDITFSPQLFNFKFSLKWGKRASERGFY